MKTWQAISLVAVLAGAGIIVQQRWGEASAKPRGQVGSHGEAAPSADAPSDDGRAGEAARATLRAMQQAVAAAAERGTGVAAQPPVEPHAKEAPKARTWKAEDLRDFYAAAFTSEDSDGRWAPRARQIAEERVREDLPVGSTLRSVDCRTSMCRIETSHEDPQKFQEFVDKSFGGPATGIWNGGAFSTVVHRGSGPGDPFVVVTFLAREGSNLPDPQMDD